MEKIIQNWRLESALCLILEITWINVPFFLLYVTLGVWTSGGLYSCYQCRKRTVAGESWQETGSSFVLFTGSMKVRPVIITNNSVLTGGVTDYSYRNNIPWPPAAELMAPQLLWYFTHRTQNMFMDKRVFFGWVVSVPTRCFLTCCFTSLI